MISNVIYEKSFPKNPALEALLKQQTADEFNAEQSKYPSFQAMIADWERHTIYIPRPYKLRNRKRFIHAAIALSDRYEMDLTITQFNSMISATFYFDACAAMHNLHKVMGMADEFEFMVGLRGHDICMILNYYTHKIIRNGIILSP